MTRLGKLAFLLKWQQMQKKNLEKMLDELSLEDQTMIETIEDLCDKGPKDIQIIIG